MAHQADGVTPMDVIGEVHCSLTRGQWTFELDALVVHQLDIDILAGNPFMVRNDIDVRPAKHQIEIGGTDIISYSSPSRHTNQPNVRRTQSFLLRNPNRTVVLPGEYLQFSTPSDTDSDTLWALEPRLDCPSNMHRKPEDAWPPPQQIQSVDHAVRISNTTDSPILLKSGEQLSQVWHILPVEISVSTSPPNTCSAASPSPATCKPFSSRVILDPDGCLDQDTREKLKALNLESDDMFKPSISKYNGASGKIEAVVNTGPTLPPQRKGRLPQYKRSTLEELQDKFDELEAAGIFTKPEQVNVHVEYLNTPFLVKKPNGGSRLVTSFEEVAQYSKPQPSLVPNVDGVLREIGKWRYMVITGLLKSFYQILLANSSMKYCGVATPFKGICVYTQSGNRKFHSTESALLYFTDELLNNMDHRKMSVIVFLDMSKVFDSIRHDLMLCKPRKAGVSESACAWFESYLSHRQQAVKIQDTLSSPLPLTVGVPQGSILGPVPFTLYINDLFGVPKHCKPLGYVDDTKLFLGFPSNKLRDVISAINEDLKEVLSWRCRNSLLINPDKTKLLYVGVPQLMKTLPATLPSATVLGSEIKPVTVTKDLGVHIDCYLNYNEHITKTASDCMFKLTRVNGIKAPLGPKYSDVSYKCFRFLQVILLFNSLEQHQHREY